MKKFLVFLTVGLIKNTNWIKDQTYQLVVTRLATQSLKMKTFRASTWPLSVVLEISTLKTFLLLLRNIKNDAPVEYVQIVPGDVIKLENFEFKFIDGDMSTLMSLRRSKVLSEKSEAKNDAAQILSKDTRSPQLDLPQKILNLLQLQGGRQPEAQSEHPQEEVPPANLNISTLIGATVFSIRSRVGSSRRKFNAKMIFQKHFLLKFPKAQPESSQKRLVFSKFTKGEQIGRRQELDQGLQWTIGRGNDVEVQVDNPKLSRAHFKIVKIAQGYKNQDLGSSNGTRLNGVGITDAPLQVFDSIKAKITNRIPILIVDPTQRSAPNQSALGAAAGGARLGIEILLKKQHLRLRPNLTWPIPRQTLGR